MRPTNPPPNPPLTSVLALLGLALSASAWAQASPTAPEPLIEVPTGVIFPASRARTEAEPSLISADETYWTPSPEQVAAFERKLPDHLEARLRRAEAGLAALPEASRANSVFESEVRHLRNVLDRLPRTARQYVGLFARGVKWIHAAGVPRDDPYEWRQRYLIVSDGGDWFWEAVYRDGGDVVQFGWHGEA
jgi:hypothetical protein